MTLEEMNKMKWVPMEMDDILGFPEDYTHFDEKSRKHLREMRKSVRDLLTLAREYRAEAFVRGILDLGWEPNWKRQGCASMEEGRKDVIKYIKKTFPMTNVEGEYSTTFTDGWGNSL